MSEIRELAFSLPEACEQDHHGIPSFRVRDKIFATVPDGEHVRVMVNEGELRAAFVENPEACEEFWWGSKLACVVVDLRVVQRELLAELLAEGWRRKAPRRLAHALDAGGTSP